MSEKNLFVDGALLKAGALENSGNPTQAEQIHSEPLKGSPSNALAPKSEISALMALYQRGDMPEALARSLAMARRYPADAFIFNICGVVHARLGRLEEAVNCYDTALAIRADYAEVHNNKGNALGRLGRIEEAIAAYYSALRINPDYAEAHNSLGSVFHGQDRFAEAAEAYQKALQARPDYAEALNNLGNALRDLGKPDQALDSFAAALRINPDLVQAYNNMGDTLRFLCRPDEAIQSYGKAIRRMPNYAEAYNGLGATLNDIGLHRKAIANIKKAILLKPDFAEAHSNLGNVQSELGLHDEAMESYKAALSLKPDSAEFHSKLGNALCEFGRYEEAIESYTKALQIRPDFAEAHISLSRLKTYHPDDPQFADMRKRLADPGLEERELMHLSFALGKVYEDLDDIEQAFKYLLQGNRLRKALFPYDINSDRAQFEQIKSLFKAKKPPNTELQKPYSQCPKKPIFIVGMPRSGTTLVEQILASHSEVFGAGELETLGRLLTPVLYEQTPKGTGQVKSGTLARMRDAYLMELAGLPTLAPFITDKMPQNFRWIGFLLTVLPGVKIVHIQREPAASCWSMFKLQFRGHSYTNDLEDVAEYYNLYLDLIDFWRREYPDQIYDLSYETLTENQEQETRKLLLYCGLDWEDQCLEFHKTKRAVRTQSDRQVRRSMYRGSSDVWRRYEAYIQPMLKVLDSRER